MSLDASASKLEIAVCGLLDLFNLHKTKETPDLTSPISDDIELAQKVLNLFDGCISTRMRSTNRPIDYDYLSIVETSNTMEKKYDLFACDKVIVENAETKKSATMVKTKSIKNKLDFLEVLEIVCCSVALLLIYEKAGCLKKENEDCLSKAINNLSLMQDYLREKTENEKKLSLIHRIVLRVKEFFGWKQTTQQMLNYLNEAKIKIDNIKNTNSPHKTKLEKYLENTNSTKKEVYNITISP